MPYRSTKEKRSSQETARGLYVKGGLSLAEISRQTGETLKTLSAWSKLGEWKVIREHESRTELDRLNSMRDSLLDRAEAQIKDGKLPHTEIGLVTKLERIIAQRERRSMEMAPSILLYLLKYLIAYLREHDPTLLQAFAPHFQKYVDFLREQDFSGPIT